MRCVDASVLIEDSLDGENILRKIEKAGRTCYKSEARRTEDSAARFVKQLISSGHESVIEHEKITVRIVCDRGVTHEIVRHRIGSYSQESTRFCNYAQDQFGKELTFITPCFWRNKPDMLKRWEGAMAQAEAEYLELIAAGASAQEARSVLPNSLKTEIVVTYNLREWRLFLKARTSEKAHPQMREVSLEILRQFRLAVPVIFDDIPLPTGKP